jgi:hypothetical protein
MRFELFLTELPKAPASKVEAELVELPKGASTRTIIRAMETRNLPTVPVAWSDDKRVLNEVMDTLVELGGGCKLVDHGSIVQKLATWGAEKLGRARYLEDEDGGPRTYIKLGGGRENESWQATLTRHALTYLLQLCLVSVLFVWFVALRVGFARIFAVPELIPQLAACAAGLLAAYMSSASVRAVQLGRVELKRALPQLLAAGCLTLASLFFLGDGYDQAALQDHTVKRPPSLPFAGLLTELRRRKLAAELGGQPEDTVALALAEQSEEAALWCDGDAEPSPEELQCRDGPAWEEALACMAEPAPRARPVASKLPRARPQLVPERAPAAAPAAPAPARPWVLTLELSTLVALACTWLLSLLLIILLRRQRVSPAAQPEESADPTTPEALVEAQLTALRNERDALRMQLVEANEELASAQLAAARAPRTQEEAQAANLQRELELTRSTLGANQAAFAQLKQQHAQATSAHSSLSAELERLKQELASTVQERDLARSALLDMGGRGFEGGHEPPSNDPGKAGVRVPTNSNADDSAYSVNRVQEERVVLQKRRR